MKEKLGLPHPARIHNPRTKPRGKRGSRDHHLRELPEGFGTGRGFRCRPESEDGGLGGRRAAGVGKP